MTTKSPHQLLALPALLLLSLTLAACGSPPGAQPGGATPVPTPADALPSYLIESVEVLVLESLPVQVQAVISGHTPDSCTRIGEVRQERNGNTFNIWLRATRPPNAACAEVLTPFTETVKLDVAGLKAGTYQIVVNGASRPGEWSFTLGTDNTPPAGDNCRTFPETQHMVCGRFLAYWEGTGGLERHGYPISEPFVETSDLNGKPYTVQYFERSVFEHHPENSPPYDVLLSQLGTYLGRLKYTEGFPRTAGEQPFYENRTEPANTLKSFYNAINRKEYTRAYGYLQGAPNPPGFPPFAQFEAGYANTAAVELAVGRITTDAGAGNIFANVRVAITATQKNGSKQGFAGCYTLHRVNTGISENQDDELWSIRSASITGWPPDATLDQLLGLECRP